MAYDIQENAQKLRKIIADPYLWIKTFMKIRDKDGKLVPFIPTRNQKYFLNTLRPGGSIILKGRQQGMSSIVLARMIWQCVNFPGTQCLFMSESDDSATAIFLKLKALYNSLPDSIRIKTKANSKKELMLDNGSRITCTVNSKTDKGRGATLDFVHLSEAGQYSDYLDDQLVALRACLVPKGYIVMESTARGLNTFAQIFFDAVRDYKDFLKQKKENPNAEFFGAYRPYFFNWIRSGNHDLETKMMAENYVKRYGKVTGKDLDDDEKELREKYNASIPQLLWRRTKISEFEGKKWNGKEIFKQEYPTTYTEAFINSGDAVFDNHKILEYLELAQKKDLLPMPDNVHKTIKKFAKNIKIWRYPERGKNFIAVDGAQGLSGDYTVFTILNENCEQVLEFSSNKIKAYESAELLREICKWYGDPLCIVENASSGTYILDKMRNDWHYQNLYRQKKSKFGSGKAKRKIGFDTTHDTKQQIINSFVEGFENDKIGINSLELLDEMEKFQVTGSGQFNGVGAHDDKVMSMAMCYEAYQSGMNGHYYA